MRNPWLGALFCAIAVAALGWATPWWWTGILAGAGFGWVWARSGRQGFFLGVLAGAAAWGMAAALALSGGGEVIARRVADLLLVGGPGRLIAITAVVGGLGAGFGALVGATSRRAFQGPESRE